MSAGHGVSGSTAPIVVKIKRQDRPDTAAYWETFSLPYKANMNLTSVLRAIAAEPVTAEGKKTSPINYDAACLEEVCGSCTVVVNGKARQACSALVDHIRAAEGDGPITIEPMSKFPIIRDLVVDRTRMFENLKRIKGWIPVDGYYKLGAGPKMDPKKQEERYALSRCMTCGCCLEACPQFTLDNAFVGAQVVAQVQYFNLHPTGKVDGDERLEAVMGEGGITDCGNAQNCVKVCPKELPLADTWGWAGRAATVYSIKKFFAK
ncbi:MAG TPA: succinate dehydrogenase iron-sulfur subunit [Phycisphaerae bacterium]|nr:succinate dehydrogenase iron-sulfur subunit [Phycisphaerae bacterium]